MDSDEEVLQAMTKSVCGETNCSTSSNSKKRKKPHIVSSWTNESTTSLIQAVEINNCIWEYSCPQYKDRAKRDKAWKEIAKEFPDHEVDGCKAKWANIKTAFLNVKKKMTTKSGQAATATVPHWPFWSAMQFYCLHDRSKSTLSVSSIDLETDTTPPPSVPPREKKSKPSVADETSTEEYAMDSAIKFLNKEEDQWHGVGMYLASQMRDLAKTNKQAANNLHVELVKTALNAVLQQNVENS